jgi:hypothetical protein
MHLTDAVLILTGLLLMVGAAVYAYYIKTAVDNIILIMLHMSLL